MTDAHANPPDVSTEDTSPLAPSALQPDPGAPLPAIQQLRAAGFSDDEQAVLTGVVLRVLAQWTQQATRDELQSALAAMEHRLTQQLASMREALHHESAQQTATLQEALQQMLTRHTGAPDPPPEAQARRREVLPWLLLTLLGLSCAGVLLLVALRLSWLAP
ncbi:MAG: hypothetical protein AB7N91_12730 [Candidatus Tectimicrobiota bacterium]